MSGVIIQNTKSDKILKETWTRGTEERYSWSTFVVEGKVDGRHSENGTDSIMFELMIRSCLVRIKKGGYVCNMQLKEIDT